MGPANRPAFCRQVPLLYAKCPSKNILQVGRFATIEYNLDGQNWKKGESCALCNRRMRLMVNGIVRKTIVKPAMMYASETWAVKKSQYVAEMRVLRLMSGVTKVDRIRNEIIRVITKVGEIAK